MNPNVALVISGMFHFRSGVLSKLHLHLSSICSSELLLILENFVVHVYTYTICLLGNASKLLEENNISCRSSVTIQHKSHLLTKNFHSNHAMAVITLLNNWQLGSCTIRGCFYSRMEWWPSSSRIKLGWWAVSRSKINLLKHWLSFQLLYWLHVCQQSKQRYKGAQFVSLVLSH